MRVWDIPCTLLCRNHLLGEHRELHAIHSILVNHKTKSSYYKHPETQRWIGKLGALWLRHQEQAEELYRRGYKHNSPIDVGYNFQFARQDQFLNTIKEQKQILREKGCDCKV